MMSLGTIMVSVALLIMALADVILASCLGKDATEKPDNATLSHALRAAVLRVASMTRCSSVIVPLSKARATPGRSVQ